MKTVSIQATVFKENYLLEEVFAKGPKKIHQQKKE